MFLRLFAKSSGSKCIALTLSITLFFSHTPLLALDRSPATALNVLPSSADKVQKRIEPVVIPRSLGSIQQYYTNDGEKSVIHIVEAHGHFEAQKSIYSLIKYLYSRYEIKTIAVEGGVGPEILGAASKYSDAKVKKNTADLFFRRGKISSEEYFMLHDAPTEFNLVGIESKALYLSNLRDYLKADRLHKKYKHKLSEIDTLIRNALNQRLSSSARLLLRLRLKFESSELDLISYLRQLHSIYSGLGKNPQTISDLGKCELPALFKVLEINRANAPDALAAIKYGMDSHFIDRVKASVEILMRSLLDSTEARSVYELYLRWERIQKLVELRITRRELIELLAHEDDYAEAFFRSALAVHAESYDDLSDLFMIVKTSLRFYKSALDRDRSIVNNTIDALERSGQNNIILITGGFHSDGVSQLLRSEGVSYYAVTPAFKPTQTVDVEENYVNSLINSFRSLQSNTSILSSTIRPLALGNDFPRFLSVLDQLGEFTLNDALRNRDLLHNRIGFGSIPESPVPKKNRNSLKLRLTVLAATLTSVSYLGYLQVTRFSSGLPRLDMTVAAIMPAIIIGAFILSIPKVRKKLVSSQIHLWGMAMTASSLLGLTVVLAGPVLHHPSRPVGVLPYNITLWSMAIFVLFYLYEKAFGVVTPINGKGNGHSNGGIAQKSWQERFIPGVEDIHFLMKPWGDAELDRIDAVKRAKYFHRLGPRTVAIIASVFSQTMGAGSLYLALGMGLDPRAYAILAPIGAILLPGVLAFVLLGDRVTSKKVTGYGLLTLGIFAASAIQLANLGAPLIAWFLGVASAFFYGLRQIFHKQVFHKDLSRLNAEEKARLPMVLNRLGYLIGTTVMLVLAIFHEIFTPGGFNVSNFVPVTHFILVLANTFVWTGMWVLVFAVTQNRDFQASRLTPILGMATAFTILWQWWVTGTIAPTILFFSTLIVAGGFVASFKEEVPNLMSALRTLNKLPPSTLRTLVAYERHRQLDERVAWTMKDIWSKQIIAVYRRESRFYETVLNAVITNSPFGNFFVRSVPDVSNIAYFTYSKFQTILDRAGAKGDLIKKLSSNIQKQLDLLVSEDWGRAAVVAALNEPVHRSTQTRYDLVNARLRTLLDEAGIDRKTMVSLDRGASWMGTSRELQHQLGGIVVGADLVHPHEISGSAKDLPTELLAQGLTSYPKVTLTSKLMYQRGDIRTLDFNEWTGIVSFIRDGSVKIYLDKKEARRAVQIVFDQALANPHGLFYQDSKTTLGNPGLFNHLIFRIGGEGPRDWTLEYVGYLSEPDKIGDPRLSKDKIALTEDHISSLFVALHKEALALIMAGEASGAIDDYGRATPDSIRNLQLEMTGDLELNDLERNILHDVLSISPWTQYDEYVRGYYLDAGVVGSHEIARGFTQEPIDLETTLTVLHDKITKMRIQLGRSKTRSSSGPDSGFGAETEKSKVILINNTEALKRLVALAGTDNFYSHLNFDVDAMIIAIDKTDWQSSKLSGNPQHYAAFLARYLGIDILRSTVVGDTRVLLSENVYRKLANGFILFGSETLLPPRLQLLIASDNNVLTSWIYTSIEARQIFQSAA